MRYAPPEGAVCIPGRACGMHPRSGGPRVRGAGTEGAGRTPLNKGISFFFQEGLAARKKQY